MSSPNCWFIRKLQHRMLRILPLSFDVAIFLTQESAVVLCSRMSVLGLGRCGVLDALITSRTASQENMIVTCSRQLKVIRSEDLVRRPFRVLLLIAGGHGTQYQILSSGKHAINPVRHVSPGNVKS